MIEIRDARAEDVHTVWTLGENVEEFHTSDQAPTFWPEDVLSDCIDKPQVYFFVAVQQDKLAGFIIANCNEHLRKVLIENIFVHPEYRGQGIGTRLAEAVVKKAKAERYEFISVLTPPDDVAAIKTYENAGFSQGETFLWLDIA